MDKHISGRHFLQIPGPSNVPDRVLHAIGYPTIDHRGPRFQKIAEEVLLGIRRIFKTSSPVLIFPSSGTGGLEAALLNTMNPGDRILMFDNGHFANLWANMAKKFGFDVQLVPTDWRRGIDPQTIEKILKEDGEHRIKSVNVVHNETSTGVTNNIPDVRTAIDRANHPALLMVDTISSLGSIEYCHEAWGVDVSVCSSQKGLMLPPGLSFNALSAKAIDISKTCTNRNHFWAWDSMLKANEKFVFPFTPSINLIFGLREAINMLEEEGLENVFSRHNRLAEATRRAVSGWGLEVYCQDPESYSSVLTTVLLPEGCGADNLRGIILNNFNLSLGNGLGKITDRVFRIGHLGDFNELSLIGTLAGIEMGLGISKVSFTRGGTGFAMRYLEETSRV